MIVVNDNTITTCPRLGFGIDSHTDFFSSAFTSGSLFTGLDPYSAASGSLNGFFAALLPPNGDLVAAAPGAGAKGERASAAPNGLSGFFPAGVGFRSNGDVAPVVASNGDFFFTDPVSPNVDGSGFGFHFFFAASSSPSFVVVVSPISPAERAHRRPR